MAEIIKQRFSLEDNIIKKINDIVFEYDISYIEAIILYSERSKIEVESLGEIVKKTPVLRAKVEEEAEGLRMIKKTTDRLIFE